ncbi:MAG: response regulator [Syntrophobacteria bacterium]
MTEKDKKQHENLSSTPHSAFRVPSSKQKILIVDDKKENLVALRQSLRGVDAEIHEATSGNEALAATLDHRFAVAILDVVMPGMSGFELAEHLREDDRTKVIPLVFLTASYADEHHMFKGYEAGGIDYIVKPYDPAVLAMKVKIFLEMDRQRQELQLHRDHLETLVAERTAQLEERAKEIRCLYAVSRLVAEPDESIDETLKAAVDLIPPGFHYPEIACARITFEGREFATANFRETPWMLHADIPIPRSSVVVCYLEEKPKEHEGPFLHEERDLLNEIARQLGVMILRRRTEEEVQEKERYFRSLLHTMHEDILVVDRDYVITDVNNTFVQTVKKTHEEVIGRHCYEVTHGYAEPCDRHGEPCGLREVFETGKPGNVQHVQTYAGGSKAYVDILLSPMKDEAGEVTRVVEAVRDVTDLMEAHEALRASEQKFRAMVDNIGIGVALVNSQMEILELNQQMREWFPDVDPAERPICYQACNDPPGRSACDDCPTVKTFQDGRVHEATREAPQAGGMRTYRVVSSPILSAQGEVTAAIEMVEDSTERQALEQQLQQSQRMEAIGRLSGGIAHDFNNILTSIIGNAVLALGDLGKEAPLYEIVEEIKRAGERAAGLTRQLLAFWSKQVLQAEVIELNQVVHEMDRMLQRVIGEDVALETILKPDLGRVEADPAQIEQIIMNLAVNARDAMPGGGKLTIETGDVELDEEYANNHVAVTPGPYVMLAVSDTGVGMTEEMQAWIFEPFFTTKEKGEGTGLGLSTVYGIVKQSNGNIMVYSEPGKGTTFKIYLPRVEKAAHAQQEAASEAEAVEGSETILVVEDDELVRNMARKALEKYGYTVLSARDGEEALRLCGEQEGPIDLVLTDVVMPGMSGSELVDRLKGLWPDLKIIYMSGYTDNAIVHRGILDKGVVFLQKPFTFEGLAQKVRQALGPGLPKP